MLQFYDNGCVPKFPVFFVRPCFQSCHPGKPEAWFEGAKQHPGSWWPHWHEWQKTKMGKLIPARKPGNARYKPIEPAPGRYVRVKG